MVRNLFDGKLDADACPMCGSPGGACNDYLNVERYLNTDEGALVLVTEDIYQELEVDGEMRRVLKWKVGEFITPEEATIQGVRTVPFMVRLDRERRAIQEALDMQGMGENKSLGSNVENKQAWKPAEDKSEQPVEDKNGDRWEDEGGATKPETGDDE